MNYELAKELRDAGFPQKAKHDPSVCCAQQGLGCHCNEADIPAFSELIEACGEEFENLERWAAEDWIAWSPKRNDSDVSEPRGKGSTPEEAVARLWLALNKKDA